MFDDDEPFTPLTENDNRSAPKVRKEPKSDWIPISPVPYVVRTILPPHKLGVPSAIWDYVDEAGRLLGAIARFDTPNDKELRPLTYCEKDGAREWRWQAMPAPRPLFALDRMAQNPTLPVLVVEGEKTAIAAQVLLPDYVITTSPGGAQAPAKASWAHLKGRRVTIWPDNHKEGVDYAVAVSKLTLKAGAEGVAIVDVPSDFLNKWDLADPLPNGWDLDSIKALISNAGNVGSTGNVAVNPTFINGTDIEMAYQVGHDLIKQHGKIVISEGWVWYYTGTHWKALSESELRRVVHNYDGTRYGKTGAIKLGKTRINSILNEFMHMHDDIGFFAKPAIGINCLSGFITFPHCGGDPVLQKHSPVHCCREVIKGNWPIDISTNDLETSKLMHLLRGCFKGDVDAYDKMALLGEVAGAVALGYGTRIMKPKAIVLKGETAENGKSQVLDVIRGLLPENANSAIPLGKFGDEKYVFGLVGKLLNTSDELTSAALIATDAFKKIITGDPTTARNVFSSITTFRPQAQHLYATNDLPSFKSGMDRGVQRRLLVLTFNRTIPESERIENIGQFIAKNEIDLLLRWAVNGAQRLLKQRGFTEPKSSKIALREWVYGADPVLAWLDQAVVLDPSAKIRTSDAYTTFKKWAVAEGYRENSLPVINNFSTRTQGSGRGVTSKRTNKGSLLIGLAIS
jgi:P4 family phage/plasmid primase-like protien